MVWGEDLFTLCQFKRHQGVLAVIDIVFIVSAALASISVGGLALTLLLIVMGKIDV